MGAGANPCYTDYVEHGSMKHPFEDMEASRMANLTLAVDDQLLRRARLRALEQNTSVNALLREYLEAFAGLQTARRQAIDEILDRSSRATSRSGDRQWTRDELHER